MWLIIETAFWLSLAVIAYGYLGYPLSMAAAAALWPRPVDADPAYTPDVDVLLVVHDADADVTRKIDNLLALEYPPEQLRVNVVCDGCKRRDRGHRTPASLPPRAGVRACRQTRQIGLHRQHPAAPGRRGGAVHRCRQRVESGAARALIAALADPQVGAVCGELVLEADNGYGEGINDYWRFEKLLRRLESASGSLIGVTGALYAARRSAIDSVPDGIILDDMWIPLSVAAAGYRVVVVPHAIAFDRAPRDAAVEERRKRRTLAGNYQLLHQWPALALPGRHPLALRLWGHKWLRLLAPWLLVLVLGLNLLLALGSVKYAALLALQLTCYAMALLGRLLPMSLELPPIRLANTFLSLNLSAALALLNYLARRDIHLWPAARAGGDVG